MKFIDLFAGIGGFRLGLEQSGHQGIWSNEIDKFANSIYSKHWGECDGRDIRTIDAREIPRHEILTGGFPCQTFSIAGNREGFDDARGTLFFEIARILEAKRPAHCLLENVKGLLSHDGGKTFGRIIEVLGELGYCVEWEVLNSKDFGVPQNRERVFIHGFRKGSGQAIFPLVGDDKVSSQETEKKLGNGQGALHAIGSTITAGYRKLNEGSTIIQVNNPRHSNNRVYDQKGIAPSLRTMQGGNRQPKILSHSWRNGDPTRGGTGPLISDEHAFTLDTSPHYVVGDLIRKLTPLECERLQGFPDNYTAIGKSGEKISNSQRYKVLGNAVTVNVIKSLGEVI